MIYFPWLIILLFFCPALSAIAIRRSLSIPWHLVLLIINIGYGIFPLLLAWGGMGLAERFSCQSETIIFNCPNSTWLGQLVTGMIFAHWLMIFTIPSAVLGAIGLLISLILKVNSSRTKDNISNIPIAIFYRSRRHKVIAGVCGVIAQKWNLPVQGVRIVMVILTVVTQGLVLFLYLWFWLAFPLDSGIKSSLVSDN